MSYKKRVPCLHIAESVRMPYNYLSNPDFLAVHYYNGNSSCPFPFKHYRGQSFPISSFTECHSAWTRLYGMFLEETSSIGLGRSGRSRNAVPERPSKSVKTGANADQRTHRQARSLAG
jgi:hypothetical protein